MKEDEIKQNFGKNLAELRKLHNLTQLALANKLNYSDKSISKWELGDVLPDVSVISEIADFFGISIDSLIGREGEVKQEVKSHTINKHKFHTTITLLSVGLVFLVMTCLYCIISPIIECDRLWILYIIGLPISSIVFVVLSHIWFNNYVQAVSISLLVWTIAVCIYFLIHFTNLWFIFIVATVMQVLIILWYIMKKYKK